ncbi:cysteine hydrolase family protein [Viridibacillus sp. NPDC096237]|uniref:cysteine hydrolase family protein n=1 Tax=Viridibacillus sp. NPDC096237 TaxID=3390721 RepID=UPI003D062930
MKKALLIIDIQNDYFAGGKMELHKPLEAAQQAKEVLTWFRDKEYPIFHIQHFSNRSDATFFLPNTKGAEIHDLVLPKKMKEEVIIKHFPNSFLETDLLNKLREKKVEELVIIGMMTHMCIDATIRAAKDIGFKCILIEDACTTKELKVQDQIVPPEHVHFAFVAALNGYYSNVSTTKEFLLHH